MEKVGYIKVYRKIQESEIWEKPSDWLKIWMHILLSVNYKANGYPPGTGKFKYSKICAECHVTRGTLDTCIRWLKINGNITTEKTTDGMVLSVANYSQYQQETTDTRQGQVKKNDSKNDRATGYESQQEEIDTTGKTTRKTTEPSKSHDTSSLYKKKEERNIIIYEEKSKLEKAIEDFYEYRKKDKRDAMGEKAKTLFLNKLEKLSGGNEEEKIRLIENAIDRSWKTVFPIHEIKIQNTDRKQAMASYNVT